jgi:hypothetical protein
MSGRVIDLKQNEGKRDYRQEIIVHTCTALTIDDEENCIYYSPVNDLFNDCKYQMTRMKYDYCYKDIMDEYCGEND